MFTRSLSGESTSCNYIIKTDLHKRRSHSQLKHASGRSGTLGSRFGMSGSRSGMPGSRSGKQIYGFGSGVTGQKNTTMASVDNRGQKSTLLASSQYASVLKPGQNIKNNRSQKPLLH
ncbi:hypothetical protein DEO72_LG8g2322 [Vigna unguiculata]|uniref:Uncharacterized protein n=1 Tax=Vigna unguiculata TaxID=3917 RepID=A0A4D6MWM0_VIGUN|nr:hypothetical protein DEO72_LG8g2322 [Vigna unguiculata]